MKNNQIAVVGGGIVGISTALYLQKQGHKVVIIDRQGIAQGCSKGNAGHFATEQVFPLADVSLLPQVPQMLFDPYGPFRIRLGYLLKAIPWFIRFLFNMRSSRFKAHKDALKALNSVALEAYEPLLDTKELKQMIQFKGSLLTFEHTRDQQIQRCLEMYRAENVNVDYLDGRQARNLEPGLSDKVTAALYFKDVAHTPDPEAFCRALADRFIASGGKIETYNVQCICPGNDRITVLHEHGRVEYSQLVLATGAWSKRLIKPLGYKLPLDTERGYHLHLNKPNPITRPVASAERKFIMTPMDSGLRLAGTVEFAGLKADMDPKRAEVLYPQAKALLNKVPTQNEDPEAVWMGMRPSLPDSLPVIGKAPHHPNLYFAFGHQHLGLTQGAITGKLIAELFAGSAPSVDLQPFCISRFNSPRQ